MRQQVILPQKRRMCHILIGRIALPEMPAPDAEQSARHQSKPAMLTGSCKTCVYSEYDEVWELVYHEEPAQCSCRVVIYTRSKQLSPTGVE